MYIFNFSIQQDIAVARAKWKERYKKLFNILNQK